MIHNHCQNTELCSVWMNWYYWFVLEKSPYQVWNCEYNNDVYHIFKPCMYIHTKIQIQIQMMGNFDFPSWWHQNDWRIPPKKDFWPKNCISKGSLWAIGAIKRQSLEASRVGLWLKSLGPINQNPWPATMSATMPATLSATMSNNMSAICFLSFFVGQLVHLHLSHHVHLHVGRHVSQHGGHRNVDNALAPRLQMELHISLIFSQLWIENRYKLQR